MARRSVLIEYTPSKGRGFGMGTGAPEAQAVIAGIPGITPDPTFGVVEVPATAPVSVSRAFNAFDLDEEQLAVDEEDHPLASSVLVRAEMDPEQAESVTASNPNVQIYSDPVIEVCAVCPNSAPAGSAGTVASLIGRAELRRAGMTGRGVFLAIVDTGLNMPYLRSQGVAARFDAARSWVPRSGLTPGELPVDHGSMCGYDATIAAPEATLLDIALLQSTRPGGSGMEGLLSDAVLAYRHLLDIMLAPRRPGDLRSMVVNNSWGMFHSSWDFAVGHPGNYSHNRNHPFNRIVRTLSTAGADILFASGNCGRECPDGRCRGVTNAGIVGANSHAYAIAVGGVDVHGERVGYSTSGPGALSRMKPDICAYTHFSGSGVYTADGGTSAACPVAAGVIAAFRSKFPYTKADARTSTAAMRVIVRRTAEDRGSMGFDFDYGYGVISGKRMAAITSLSATGAFETSAVPEEAVRAFEEEMAANARAAAPAAGPAEHTGAAAAKA